MPAFARTKYQSDGGDVHAIRLSPEKVPTAGAPPAAVIDTPIRVKVSKGNQEYGIRPRGVVIGRTVGVAPDTFVRTAFIPVLTPTTFASAAYAEGAFLAYKGFEDWQIINRVIEDY